MAIISFALTTKEFMSGIKTVTRRDWNKKQLKLWQKWYDEGKIVHDAWGKLPRSGGKKIGKFKLTQRPYSEKLADMPKEDLKHEGGMCKTKEEYFKFIHKSPEDTLSVVRFVKI